MRSRLSVDLGRIGRNYRFLESAYRGKRLTAVVKADAYGLGADRVARTLYEAGCRSFAVATAEEGVKLRAALCDCEILVLGYVPPEDATALARSGIVVSVEDYEHYLSLSDKSVSVAVAVNVGMNRFGLDAKDFERTLAQICEIDKKSRLTSVYAHFSYHAEDGEKYLREVNTFRALVSRLKKRTQVPVSVPMSAADAVDMPFDTVRAGISLYGLTYDPSIKPREGLLPAAAFYAQVALVRTIERGERVGYGGEFVAQRRSRIAVVSVGYADGLDRRLTGAEVLIRGGRARIVGRICMDVFFVDVTEIKNVAVGDEVMIFGDELPLSALSARAKTIDHELISRIGKRVPRIYSGSGLF